MGGSGSGYWYRCNSKETTENQNRVDIRWLKKEGYLWPGNIGILAWSCRGEQSGFINYKMKTDCMTLDYRYRLNGGEWEPVEQAIFFDRTPCNYGGYRTWFICPQCLKRVAVLYAAGKYFLCRHCYNLTYSSQQEDRPNRLMRAARKIRRLLGGGDDMMDFFPEKPKNMHWKTYRRLRDKAGHASKLSWAIMGQRFGDF